MTIQVAMVLAFIYGEPDLSTLRLRLETSKRDILVGEPLRLTIGWSASSPVTVTPRRVELFLVGPARSVQWHEVARSSEMAPELTVTLRPGEHYASAHTIGVGIGRYYGRSDRTILAFEAPGMYGVQARYGTGGDSSTSNLVSIEVSEPSGEDHTLLEQYIRREPLLVSEVAADLARTLDPLLAAHPQSPYLHRPLLAIMAKRLRYAIGSAPEGIPAMGDVPDLLNRLATADFGTSSFREDQLLLLAEMQEKSGRRSEARSTYAHILSTFPNGAAAVVARRHFPLQAK